MHIADRPVTPRRLGSFVPAVIALVTVAGVAGLAAVAAPATPASAGTVTVASVLKASKAAIAQQTSAHVAFNAKSGTSSAKEEISGDVGTSTGMETVTYGKAVLEVRVTSKDGYISGTATGLTSLFGMTAAEAKKLGTRWEFWKSGTTQYKELKKDIGEDSLQTLAPSAKGTTLTTAGSDYALNWTSAATSSTPALTNTLTISMRTKLPIEETSTDTAGERVTTRISKWGESVDVHAPPGRSTVAASTISG
jgi:hypothetical protein